ncbi:MAG TPA: BlaI/MecI/CopY family transcriptional regulator [Gemmatimonadaceae bacterium]|nr:BlaI/MecI/CopY family transcriptional regulator [Gemmatimonadaceae bacterium]
MADVQLGDRELEVMTWLWANGSGTVTEVKEGLADPLAYTTVLTILRNLEAKGFLRREDEGRAHRYFPRVQQKAARRRALRRLIDTLFLGSPEALLTHLVDEQDLSEEERRRIAKRLTEQSRKPGGAR